MVKLQGAVVLECQESGSLDHCADIMGQFYFCHSMLDDECRAFYQGIAPEIFVLGGMRKGIGRSRSHLEGREARRGIRGRNHP